MHVRGDERPLERSQGALRAHAGSPSPPSQCQLRPDLLLRRGLHRRCQHLWLCLHQPLLRLQVSFPQPGLTFGHPPRPPLHLPLRCHVAHSAPLSLGLRDLPSATVSLGPRPSGLSLDFQVAPLWLLCGMTLWAVPAQGHLTRGSSPSPSSVFQVSKDKSHGFGSLVERVASCRVWGLGEGQKPQRPSRESGPFGNSQSSVA